MNAEIPNTLLPSILVSDNLHALDLVPSTDEVTVDESGSAAPTDSFEEQLADRLAESPYLANLPLFHATAVSERRLFKTLPDQSGLPGVDLMEQGLRIFQTSEQNDVEREMARKTYIAGLIAYAKVSEFSPPLLWTNRAAELRFDKAVAAAPDGSFKDIRFRDIPYDIVLAALAENPDLFAGANLNEADLAGADLHGVDMHGVDLCGVNLHDIDLHGADLHMTHLYWASLRGADLRGANLRGVDLHGVDLSWANLRKADLTGANLRDTYLYVANLRGASLHAANMRCSYLYGANLRQADLIEADLRDADLRCVRGGVVNRAIKSLLWSRFVHGIRSFVSDCRESIQRKHGLAEKKFYDDDYEDD